MIESSRYAKARPHVLILAVLALLLPGCGGSRRSVAIRDLLDDPGRYNGQTVRVEGEVTENISLLGAGGYRLDDGTGTITVVAKEGGAPSKGAKIGLLGKFRSAFTLGATNAAVIMETRRFKP